MMIKNECNHAYKLLDHAECLWCENCVEELVKRLSKKPKIAESWIHEKQKAWTNGYWRLPNHETITVFEYTQNFIRSLIKKMQLNKITVNEKFIKKEAEQLVNRFHYECKLSHLQQIGILCVLTEKGDLWDLLIRAGVEIVKK